MSEAYAQIELDDGLHMYSTINTYKGMYQYRRISYGVKSAPSLFQKIIEPTLAGIPNVLVFLDEPEKPEKLKLSIRRICMKSSTGCKTQVLRLGIKKCQFNLDAVCYLGHKVYLAKATVGKQSLPKCRYIWDV